MNEKNTDSKQTQNKENPEDKDFTERNLKNPDFLWEKPVNEEQQCSLQQM